VVEGMVFDVQRFSLHDGPGIRTTVFLSGCALRCPWCQNPEGLGLQPVLMYSDHLCKHCGACAGVCPTGAHTMGAKGHRFDRKNCTNCGACPPVCPAGALRMSSRNLTFDDVVQAIAEDEPYFTMSGGGVTISGGEPLVQADFTAAILAACKSRGISTAVESCLAVSAEQLALIEPHCDLFLVDIKHAETLIHQKICGQGNQDILSNLRHLAGRFPLIIRTPLIPGFNTSVEAVSAIGAIVASLPGVRAWELLPYHRLGEAKRASLGQGQDQRSPLTPAELEILAKAAEKSGVNVIRLWAPAQIPAPANNDPWSYDARYERLRATKHRQTAEKRKLGARDQDDWGQLHLPAGGIRFTPTTDHPKGYILGARDCARNFAAFLQACPTFADPDRTLLGGYYDTFNRFVTGWDPDLHWPHLAPDFDRYGIIHGIDNNQHFLCDIAIGLKLGWKGLLAKIAQYRPKNPTPESQAYYDGLELWIRGVQAWMKKHSAAARDMATASSDPRAAKELREQADLSDSILEEAPQTFRAACQWLTWYQMAKRVYIGGGSIGRLDVELLPLYERDIAAGILDDGAAVFHIACFLLADSSYIQVGGIDATGKDSTNPVSFLVIEAAHRLKIPANIAVMVHDHMDQRLLNRAVELLFVDRLGIPRFCGQESIEQNCLANGFTPEMARARAQAGCNWFCVPGREYCFSDVIKINFAKVFLASLDTLMVKDTAPSVEKLWQEFERHLARAVEVVSQGIDWHCRHQESCYPELALSLLCHGPIEHGRDASRGGVELMNIGVDGSGLATVADSFAAVQDLVENRKAFSWNALQFHIKRGWWGPEGQKARILCNNVGGFGRGGTLGDLWANKVSKLFTKLVTAKPTPDGHKMTPGLFSWASTISMGRDTPATPDGRRPGEPISFGANPNPGRQRGGALTVTSVSSSIARVQCGRGNPGPFQFDVDPGTVASADDASIHAFGALIRTHFRLGGLLINANVLDSQAIKEAVKDPNAYPDLVVRVTGFSAYFAALSEDFRRLVYERIVSAEGGNPALDPSLTVPISSTTKCACT